MLRYESVAVIIATYGSRKDWNPMANRALRSATAQTRLPDEVLRVHRDSLQSARNEGGEAARADWLIFCDGDDEIESRYVERMLACNGDMRYPAVRYLQPGWCEEDGLPEPICRSPKPLFTGNYMPIGTMIRRDVFLRVGGFPDYPVYEDWALFMRMRLEGQVPMPNFGAVYRAWCRDGGRNRVTSAVAMEACRRIVRDYAPLAKQRDMNLQVII